MEWAAKQDARETRMAKPTYAELTRWVAELTRENGELSRRCERYEHRIRELEDQVRKLTHLLEESTRAAKRQAAPFSKGEPKSNPKKPGRKPGEEYGQPSRRQPPPPDQIDETYEALLPEVCPDCDGPVKGLLRCRPLPRSSRTVRRCARPSPALRAGSATAGCICKVEPCTQGCPPEGCQ